jgi:hypothetical protein
MQTSCCPASPCSAARDGSVPSDTLIPELGPLRSEHLTRGDQLLQDGRTDDALQAYTDELQREGADHFTRGMAHKRIITTFARVHGWERAFAEYDLTRVDDREIAIAPGEVLCCATVHDEADRLPFFLAYYEQLGVDCFLFIDNGSTDATRELLLERPNVHVWSSDMRYWRANYGMAWVEAVLQAYGCDRWCVIADTDELLCYPGAESRSLHDLCDAFDRAGTVAMAAVLLDMYSRGPIREAVCEAGTDPIDVCPCFDRAFYHSRRDHATPWENVDAYWGGVRRRVFGEESDVFLTKVPLVRYTKDTLVLAGTHGTNAPADRVADVRGALLHFKFTARFVERLEEEIRSRSEWDAQGESYSTYARMIAEHPDLSLYDPQQSVVLRDSAQLVELAVMSDGSDRAHAHAVGRPSVDDYVARMHDLVPGWFTELDASLFRAVDVAQRAGGVAGDVLEVGVFLGKSAILLGYLLRRDEELVAWDLFSGASGAEEADAAFYRDLSQAAFEENYRRFHERPPTAVAGPSTELPAAGLGRRFRIVHVDGSHRYEIARSDIASALDLLVDGGVLVVDDYRTVPHALGVAAAVWEAVTAGRLVPVLASDQKLYGLARGRDAGVADLLRRAASEHASLPGAEYDVVGHAVAVFTTASMTTGQAEEPGVGDEPAAASPDDTDEVAALRRRLELVEGSRTWRLRGKLMRFWPFRR